VRVLITVADDPTGERAGELLSRLNEDARLPHGVVRADPSVVARDPVPQEPDRFVIEAEISSAELPDVIEAVRAWLHRSGPGGRVELSTPEGGRVIEVTGRGDPWYEETAEAEPQGADYAPPGPDFDDD
jgi:hypothetical protein